MNQQDRDDYVTCVRAAELLDVSISTIKRMCDQQTLDCARTSGGHRRISMESILRWSLLQKSQDLSERAANDEHSVYDVELTLDRLLSGSMKDLERFIRYLRSQQWTIPRVLDDVLLSALRDCSSMCDSEEAPQYVSSQCVAAIRDVIGHLILGQECLAVDAPVAVGGCVGPARHDLHSSAISLGLRSIGCRAISIGCRVAPGDLSAAAAFHRASIVWMNCSHVADAEELQRFAQDLSSNLSESQLMLVTGSGTCRLNRRQLPCDLASDSIVELTEFVAHRTFRNAKSIVGVPMSSRAA